MIVKPLSLQELVSERVKNEQLLSSLTVSALEVPVAAAQRVVAAPASIAAYAIE